MSENPSSGGIAGMGAGLGMGLAAGSAMGSLAQAVFQQSTPTSTPSAEADPVEKLAKLKQMLDSGLIEQADYDAVKKEILAKML